MEFEYEQFIKTIQHRAEASREEAERAAGVTLATLAERLSAGEARDIAEQLPRDLGSWLADADGAEPFHADEFLRRIAQREGVDLDTAERHARAVFTALGRAVKHQELEDMATELPKDFEPLIADALSQADRLAPEAVVPAEEFIQRVADRTGLEPGAARRATEAVLETLGERVSAGEIEDLAAQLAPELRIPLERGNIDTRGKAQRMSTTEFVEFVADREGIPLDQAWEHTSAVLRTLQETISEKEFADLMAQLPDDFAELLWRPVWR
jgi:uncharacterized protein (DUF2267 family)